MTDQPTSGKDETRQGYQPPPYTQQQEDEISATQPLPRPETGYGQPQQYGQDSQQYGQPQQYGQDSQQYGAPGQQYGAPGQPAAPYNAYAQQGSPYNAYGQPNYYGVLAEPKGLSIASLCCGIAALVGFGFFILPQIAAVILGHMALSREPAGKGMAIAGLVLGYVAIAVTILVIVIFAVAIGSARYSGYGV
ncbi:DUF4190 domain-containing protein [Arthrobacter sp. UYCu712]|uniref:DUF4190 domain-containing protein n=1 Tax=Arthrobacter sp. UYCu712 TaxID=3156340 RepID=UPI00339AF02F